MQGLAGTKVEQFVPLPTVHTAPDMERFEGVPVNYQLPQQLVVVRDPEVIDLIRELRHVLNDTCIQTKNYSGDYLNIPVIDLDAMLEYVMSDLDKIVAGSITAESVARQYIFTEVMDHDVEFTPLIAGVMHLVMRILIIAANNVLTHPFDHYVPHQYELQRVLPSGGLVLRRIDL